MTRDEHIAALADRIANNDGPVTMFDVLAELREEWCDLSDYLALLDGNADVIRRHRLHHETLALRWLQTSARGQALVDREIERDEELDDSERAAA